MTPERIGEIAGLFARALAKENVSDDEVVEILAHWREIGPTLQLAVSIHRIVDNAIRTTLGPAVEKALTRVHPQ